MFEKMNADTGMGVQNKTRMFVKKIYKAPT